MNNSSSSVSTAPYAEHRKPQTRNHSKNRGWIIFLVLVTVAMLLGYFATHSQQLYKPGDDIGYNMGLVGGIMLLALLLYPLRKRVRILKGLGVLPTWFKWHMIFGILAPTLILFHSTFQIGSINAGMALIAMMLVSGSGIFGRFFYTKIHNGLYGRQANLKELQDDLLQTGSIQSKLSFAPEIQKQLEQFKSHTTEVTKSSRAGFLHFGLIGVKALFLNAKLKRQLHHAMYSVSGNNNWSKPQLEKLDVMYEDNLLQIRNFISAVRDVAQFHTYERLFSWWHIFHIPLVYLLVFSGIFHVISVHMY